MSAGVPAPTSLPLVIIDTNVIFDFFLGRDPDVLLLAQLVPAKVEIHVPEFVLFEFRGSVLRELGAKEKALSQTRALANELERADGWKSGVGSLRAGCDAVMQDIEALRGRLDPKVFLTKDADFLKKAGVRAELSALGVDLVDAAGPLYGRYR